jgi:RecA-family ATPase
VSGYREAAAITAATVRREYVEWCLPGRVPFGSVTVIVGDGGLGKSTWTCSLAAIVSLGSNVLMATAEDSLAATLKPRLEAVQAELDRVHFVTMRMPGGDEEGLTIPDDLPELERLVTEKSARLVVIDPLTAHLAPNLNSWSDHSVRRALAPLHRLAEATGAAVLVVMHLNKGASNDPMRRIGGSVAFGNAARSVLVFARDPDDPDGEQGRRRVLAHQKCNLAPLASSLLLELEPILLPATAVEPEVKTSRLRQIGETHHNGRDLLAAPDREDRSAIDEAKAFLESELQPSVRRRATGLLQHARRLDISERTLRRAKKELGVQSAKHQFEGHWEWWREGGQEDWQPSENGDAGNLHRNGSTMLDSGVSEPVENAEGSQSHTLATFEGKA